MERFFICLANSLKRGGRCIAGVEVTVDDGRWTVVRKADGSPRWLRPIDRATEFGEIMIGEARNIPLLSMVKLEDVVLIPQQAHQEDVHYSVMRAVGRVSASAAVLRQFVDEAHPVIFYGTDRAIDIPTYQTADHSLMFVHADSADIVADVREDKTRYRMLLGYRGVTYDLSVTDPDYIEALNGGRISLGAQADVYVTLSLGLVYEERHHKLVAAVIAPSSYDVADNIVLSCVVETRELSVRPLTKAERKTIKRAFIVPTQHGLAVCVRRKGGSEDFLPLDNNSEGEVWAKVNLRRLMIVEYDDGVKKARIKPQQSHWIVRLTKIYGKVLHVQ